MKTLITLLSFILATALAARDITFAWDLNPETDILRYRLETATNAGGPWILGGVTPDGAVPSTVNEMEIKGLPNNILFVRAFAVNVAGLESEPSEILQVNPDRPGKPGKPRIKVVLQSSTNLKDWKNAIVFNHDPVSKSEFFRAIVEVTPGT